MDISEAEVLQIASLPRVSIQAFCETPEVAQTVQNAAEDRRMEKAHLRFQMGGAPAAVEAYRNSPTPNVIIIETDGGRPVLMSCLDKLSEVCDYGTKVIVIGRVNDVLLYRDLMRRGISEYLVAPIQALDLVRTMSELFRAPDAEPLGRVVAFVGAKGGVGASTVAHNVAWSIARNFDQQTVVADLDMAFGTAGLDFNQDPPQGIADAVFAPDRLDSNLVDRLLTKCTAHLSLLAAPATVDRTYDFQGDAFDGLYDILRNSAPSIVLDVPHCWTAWSKRALIVADEIVVVASPDLANLRNAKNIIDLTRGQRPHDAPPRLVLNQVGLPKRPEIKASEFAKALDVEPSAVIAFEPQLFGTASNNGQMIAEISASHKLNEQFLDIARQVTGRTEQRTAKRSFNPLARLRKRA
ncbi:pilus assembly protein [Terrihabitans soli]|uniref:Pilus assembly protein n=1 Tax=Terrihabitans soli TaxID=708113 RepID=A0A6S6QYC0_9HYPH|nr:AAA family ATPase [Terrihabitans soli]BCJ92031.1 pilus assembly protein [Terrihabitans soli]